MKLIKSFLASVLLFASASSHAEVIQFGELLAGSAPASHFATMNVTGSGKVYQFTLSTQDLDSLFSNSGVFIGRLAVETDPDISLVGRGATTLEITNVSGGVTSIDANNAGGPQNAAISGWDFSFVFGQGAANRLTGNESVSWTATFSQDVVFTHYAIHVQGLTNAQGSSAWYSPSMISPVPEPESFGLLVLGLCLMGASVKRKNELVV